MWTNILQRLVINRSFNCINFLNRSIQSSVIGSTAAASEEKSRTTVDKEDVGRHAKQTKEWWDPEGSMKALHKYNLIRVPFVRDGLADCALEQRNLYPLQGKSILDVGCGGGLLSESLARLGAKVTGVDASKDLIELATYHSSLDPKIANNRPTYVCTSIEEHAEKHENVYDGVVASEIIEHVSNPELFVKSCARVLRPGGRIFITTPNRTRLAEIGVICLAENVFQTVPKGTHQIEKFLTPPEVSLMLERNSCHVELVHGIMFNFLTSNWSWSTYQHFAYAIQALKLECKEN